jgi:hypothetical protein
MCRVGVGNVVNIDVLSRIHFLLPLKRHTRSLSAATCHFYRGEDHDHAATLLISREPYGS